MSPKVLILTSSQNGAMSGTEKIGNEVGIKERKGLLNERIPFVLTYTEE